MHCTLYRSRFGFGICKIEPHIEHWWVIISGSLGRVSSKSSKTVPADVQPTSSWYLSPSSEISDSLSPNLIRRRRRFFFFGAGRDFGLPLGLFEGGVFGAPFGGGPRFCRRFFAAFWDWFLSGGRWSLSAFLEVVCALPFFGGGGAFLFCWRRVLASLAEEVLASLAEEVVRRPSLVEEGVVLTSRP